MTAVAYVPSFLEPPPIYAHSNAASQLGQTVSALLLDFTAHARSTATDWRTKINASIEEIASECRTANWDGHGASPIDREAKAQAQRFVDLLPFHLPAPEAIPDPDGELALSWDFGPGHVFTVSVSGEGALTYAGLLGGGIKRHGVEQLNGDIPRIILQSIDELRQRAGVAA